jgi:hypothetical protein
VSDPFAFLDPLGLRLVPGVERQLAAAVLANRADNDDEVMAILEDATALVMESSLAFKLTQDQVVMALLNMVTGYLVREHWLRQEERARH